MDLYFGTRNHERFVPMFIPGADYSRVGYSSKSQYLNGGARLRRSKATHREYVMTWPASSTRDELRPIIDFFDGVYDDNDGTNLIYFIDPVAADKNVAPQIWGSPALGAGDGMPLISSVRPTLSATPANTLGYPARSATYTLTGSETAETLYIPIPTGFTAWVGAHGSATGSGGVQVTPFNGPAAGTPVTLTLLAETNATRVNASFASTAYSGIELQLKLAGSVTLSGIIVQILPTGTTPETGGFISGQGHSGCDFESAPQVTPYQITGRSEAVGMTMKLTEIGSWI